MLCYRKSICTIAHTNTWFQVQSDQSNIFLRICFDSLIYEPIISICYQFKISGLCTLYVCKNNRLMFYSQTYKTEKCVSITYQIVKYGLKLRFIWFHDTLFKWPAGHLFYYGEIHNELKHGKKSILAGQCTVYLNG